MSGGKSMDIAGDTAFFGAMVERMPGLWAKLGNIETSYLKSDLDGIQVQSPIYIAGLARSGSTILLEVLSRVQGIGTHRYRDFPLLFAPVAWNWFLDKTPRKPPAPAERAHKDRILVTPESPEAMEEVLWMHFFADAHNPAVNNTLDGNSRNDTFDAFYRDHIRKLLLVRKARRYLSKGNYNIARLRYLLALFPDARTLLPVRDPVSHIASLIKQHRLFCEAEAQDERLVAHMRRVGHFEFGLDLRPINTGDTALTQEIQALIASNQPVRGWALYWSAVYDYARRCLEADPALAAATQIVRYEAMCASPAAMLQTIADHCGLAPGEDFIAKEAAGISAPTYYRHGFSDAELAIIQECCSETAAWFNVPVSA